MCHQSSPDQSLVRSEVSGMSGHGFVSVWSVADSWVVKRSVNMVLFPHDAGKIKMSAQKAGTQPGTRKGKLFT